VKPRAFEEGILHKHEGWRFIPGETPLKGRECPIVTFGRGAGVVVFAAYLAVHHGKAVF